MDEKSLGIRLTSYKWFNPYFELSAFFPEKGNDCLRAENTMWEYAQVDNLERINWNRLETYLSPYPNHLFEPFSPCCTPLSQGRNATLIEHSMATRRGSRSKSAKHMDKLFLFAYLIIFFLYSQGTKREWKRLRGQVILFYCWAWLVSENNEAMLSTRDCKPMVNPFLGRKEERM